MTILKSIAKLFIFSSSDDEVKSPADVEANITDQMIKQCEDPIVDFEFGDVQEILKELEAKSIQEDHVEDEIVESNSIEVPLIEEEVVVDDITMKTMDTVETPQSELNNVIEKERTEENVTTIASLQKNAKINITKKRKKKNKPASQETKSPMSDKIIETPAFECSSDSLNFFKEEVSKSQATWTKVKSSKKNKSQSHKFAKKTSEESQQKSAKKGEVKSETKEDNLRQEK